MYRLQKKDLLYYLFLLMPFTYLIGIFLTELFVLFTILFFLIKNRSIHYFKDQKFTFLLFFSIYVALNAFVQIDDNLRISSLFHFRYLIYSLSIVFFLQYFEEIKAYVAKNILFVFFFLISLIIFDALYQYFIGENILGFKIFKNRISSFFGEELILGSFLLKILPILTWLIFYSNFDSKNNQKKLIIFLSFYIICIFISGERTAIGLALIYFILVIFFINPLRRIFFISLVNLLIFILLISYFDVGKTDLTNRIFIKTFNQFTNQYFTQNKSREQTEVNSKHKVNKIKENLLIFSKDHTGHYKLALELFKNSPIFGIGPKGFRHYCRDVKYDPEIGICSTHPHNYFVQITAETGLVGLSLYCFVIIFIIFKLFKIEKIDTFLNHKLSLMIISIGLLINLFPFLPSGNFFNNWISIINYFFFGIYIYYYDKVFKQ